MAGPRAPLKGADMPRPRKQGRIYVARESGVAEIAGESCPFTVGVTRVREGHPLLDVAPASFEPISVHYDVEQATAVPGERRGERVGG